MFKSIPTKDSQFPQLPKCFKMEFGLQKSRVLVSLFKSPSLHIFISQKSVALSYFLFFVFYFKHSSLHHFVILPIFHFPRQDCVAWLYFFLLVKSGVVKNSVWCGGDLKKICLWKKYPLNPPSPLPAVYIMNVALSLVMVFTPYVLNFRPYRLKRWPRL